MRLNERGRWTGVWTSSNSVKIRGYIYSSSGRYRATTSSRTYLALRWFELFQRWKVCPTWDQAKLTQLRPATLAQRRLESKGVTPAAVSLCYSTWKNVAIARNTVRLESSADILISSILYRMDRLWHTLDTFKKAPQQMGVFLSDDTIQTLCCAILLCFEKGNKAYNLTRHSWCWAIDFFAFVWIVWRRYLISRVSIL